MESWTYSIHKNGSKTDPSDYRGITLLSSLGKLFTALVYNRIENEIKSKDIFSPSQGDFSKSYRTIDIIFTLFSLIRSKGKYLYNCFVHFRKPYDSICWKCLLRRLKEKGLIGKIFDIFKSMHRSPKVSLIRQDKIRLTFLTSIGLKQGDVLSTILFNININDLPKRLLEDSRSSDTIYDVPYPDDVPFADDLAIFSLSKGDLQKRISILKQYSNEWGLELNLSKTKVVIFN